jgi:hypothetical protein
MADIDLLERFILLILGAYMAIPALLISLGGCCPESITSSAMLTVMMIIGCFMIVTGFFGEF